MQPLAGLGAGLAKHQLARRQYQPGFLVASDAAATEIYTLSLHDALPIFRAERCARRANAPVSMPTGKTSTRIVRPSTMKLKSRSCSPHSRAKIGRAHV